VYPELVIRNEDGRIEGVRYEELAPMLLNEMQQQQQKMATQDAQLAAQALGIRQLKEQQTQIAEQMAKFQDMQRRLAVLIDLKNSIVASR
jgi:hypothetical protein